MNLNAIKEARAAKTVEMRGILAKAETEKRSLTDIEKTGFDKLRAEVTALEADETRASFMAEQERRMTGEAIDKPLADLQSRINVADVIRAQTQPDRCRRRVPQGGRTPHRPHR